MNKALSFIERRRVRHATLAAFVTLGAFLLVPIYLAVALTAHGQIAHFMQRHFLAIIASCLGLGYFAGAVFVIAMFRVRCPTCHCRLLESRRGEAACKLVFYDDHGRRISRIQNFATAVCAHHLVCLRCGEDFDLSS